MIKRAVLTALSSAVASADERVAHRALPPLDPILAWLARRRLSQALRFAYNNVVNESADPLSASLHVLHVAWLFVADESLDSAAFDPRAARAAYEDASQKNAGPSSSGRWVTPVAICGVVGLTLCLFLLTRPAPDPSAGPVGRALTQSLTDWVVALDRWAPINFRDELGPRLGRHGDTLAALRATTLAPDVTEALGEPAAAALAQVMTATRALAAVRSVPDGMEPHVDAFREAIRGVNGRFAEVGVPYFIDGDWLIHQRGYIQTTLFVFSIVARHRIDAGLDAPLVAVHLTRIDNLNWVRSLLGYTRKSMDVAVVLLDKVEEILVTWVGPSLSNGAEMPILETKAGRAAWQENVRVEAGKVARAAFERVLPDDRTALRDFGALLKTRQLLFAKWRRKMDQRGYRLAAPGTLEISDELYEALEEMLPDFQVRELRDLQRSLESSDNMALFSRMRSRLARSVEGHEVQHRLDYAREGGLPLPGPLRDNMGVEATPDAAIERRVERANFECSAYLSEIGREPQLARLNLTLLARHVFESRGAEWQAAVAILDGLAETLGLIVRTSGGNTVRRRLAAQTYLALVRADEGELVAAARTLWKRWYGQDLATLLPAEP